MAIELFGNWHKGFALDLHTESSEYLGTDELGHERFKTTRSEIGELVYKLKYNKDTSVIETLISEILSSFTGIEKCDYIIPIPPSNTNRPWQPVILIGQHLAKACNVPILEDALIKTDSNEEIKNIQDKAERTKVLKDVVKLNKSLLLKDKNILLIDDLYRSGATLSVATDILYNVGNAKRVNVLTLTKTRRNR
jgi:competence protein ComFC